MEWRRTLSTAGSRKFGGMEVSEAKRLRELEAENARLQRLLAEAELNKAALKEIVSKKW
jgi:putative transposase